jgi:hypothetical protein
VNGINSYYKRLKTKIYQKIADNFIGILGQSVQQTDDRMFEVWYEMAMRFNQHCVDQEIYLD